MSLVRLRYRIDSARLLREHVHFADGVGYFFFPDKQLATGPGTGALLEIELVETGDAVLLRGIVWTRAATGGLWLELPGAARALARLERAAWRGDRRIATAQLVLLESSARPLLCRLSDLSLGGARIAAEAWDFGARGEPVRVSSPEGDGPIAQARVVWAANGQLGLAWLRDDLPTRALALKLLQAADDEWESAPTATHARGCRCGEAERQRGMVPGMPFEGRGSG
jgi:hypothetical protein